MRSALTQLVMVLLVSCVTFAPKEAAAHDPFAATLTGDHDILAALNQKPARAGDKFPSIRFQAKDIFGLGSARFVFNARKLPAAEAVLVRGTRSSKDQVVPTLLKGFVLLNRGNGDAHRVPAALSVIKNRARIQFFTGHAANQAKAPRLYALSWKLTMKQSVTAKVSTKQNGSFLGKLCDTHAEKKADAHSILSTTPSKITTQARVITLSTDADPEWYAAYGDASNAEIAAIVNATEAIFERQLGVRFALVRQHVYIGSSPYVSTDSSALLASFAKNPENPANLGFSPLTFDQDVDVKHLFTGKDLDGNVIGLAYVGAICWSPKNAYGLSQNTTRDLNITTFLHEVGHTLGASHDTSDAGSIMFPNLGIKRYFSPISLGQINRMLAANGACVSQELVGANLANATLTLTRKFTKNGHAVVFTGKLVSNLLAPLPGELVKLTINKRVVPVTTDNTGMFTYRINLMKLKSKKLNVFAQTANSETSIRKPLKVQVRA